MCDSFFAWKHSMEFRDFSHLQLPSIGAMVEKVDYTTYIEEKICTAWIFQIIHAFTKWLWLLFYKYEPNAEHRLIWLHAPLRRSRATILISNEKRSSCWIRYSCKRLSSPILHYARHHFDTWTRTNQERERWYAICQIKTNKLVVQTNVRVWHVRITLIWRI